MVDDGTIDEAVKHKTIPYIDKNLADPNDYTQDQIDNAIVHMGAYRAFASIPLKSTISGGGLTANLSPRQYRQELKQDASQSLAAIGLSLPEQGNPAPFTGSTDGMYSDQQW
ncbi:MAG: hypothetical protein ABEH81_01045 [Halopenitus sp.]